MSLLYGAGYTEENILNSGVQNVRSEESMTVCLAISGIGMVQYKIILQRFCSHEVTAGEYDSIFSESSPEFREIISVCLDNLKCSHTILVDELKLRSDVDILTEATLVTFGSTLLELTAALQDLFAHLKQMKHAIEISSKTSALMVNLSYLFNSSAKRQLDISTPSQYLQNFKSIPAKLRNLICKLLHIDCQILRRLFSIVMTDNMDGNDLSILEMSRIIFNIRVFLSSEMCDLVDEMSLDSSRSSLSKLSIEELVGAAGLCAQVIGAFPFDFDNADLVRSIEKLIKCKLPDFKTDKLCTEYLSTFHDLFVIGTEFTDEDNYLTQIIGAYSLAGELSIKFKNSLLQNPSDEARIGVIFEEALCSYYTGICWMYAAFTSTASDLIESKCEVSERAEKMFLGAKSSIKGFYHSINPYLDIKSSYTEENPYRTRDWLALSGDISYHLSFTYLRLHQLGSQRVNVLTYALEEANHAKKFYSEVNLTKMYSVLRYIYLSFS